LVKAANDMKRFFYILSLLILCGLSAFSQGQEDAGSKAVTFKTIYDDPSDLYKLWIGFQPLYADLFVTNVNAGFGGQAIYYHNNLFDCKFQVRKTYAQFSDLNRNMANKSDEKNVGGSTTKINNEPTAFTYFELGGTYHIVDKTEQAKAKIILYSSRYKKWASSVPQYIWVPAQVRTIYGARVGGLIFNTATDLQRAMAKQGVTIKRNGGDDPKVDSVITPSSGNLTGNVHTKALYIGVSASKIKNIAIKPDKGYGVLVNDMILTAYLDLIIAPSVQVDDVILNSLTYSTDPIKTKMLGGRIGFDGMFNREFSWSYGMEAGFRPSVATGGFYAMLKLNFPMFATKLSQQKEAFGK
jgi:hypothetical protein